MANNSNHIMSRYGKWITNKQKERLRKLYKGYRQSTAGDMRSQYLNAHKGMYGVRTTASAYGLGEGYVARKKAQMDSSLAEAGRQYAAQADAAFENNAVRPAANATIQAENERKQREYEEKLRKAREKAAKQAKAQADYEKALEEYNRNKDKTDKENAKRLAEYKKAMAKYRKELKNAKRRGEKLDRLPQRQILHGGQPLPKGLSLSADLHQYEGATSSSKPKKGKKNLPLPKKGKNGGRGGLLSTDMYEYESGIGHQPIATSHQGLNNRPVAPKTNYAANQTAVQKRKKAKEAVVGKPTKPILAITDTPVPVPPHIEKDLVAKAEAMKPEEVPQLKADYINSAVEHENLVGDLYNALKPDMNRVSLAQEFNHWVGVAQNTTLSPAERKQAAMYASRAAEEYNLQDNGKAHKERVATLMQMVNDSHDQLVQQQYLLQQKGVRMSEDEIGFDTGYLRQYGAIPAQANDATYAQAQALGDKNSDLGKQLRELTKMEYLHSQGLPSGQLSPQMQAFIAENNLGWLIDQEVLDRAPLVGIETAIEEKLKKGGDERTEYLQRKGIDRVQRELSTSNPEAIKRVIGSGDSITHLKKLSQTDVSLATIQAMATGGGHQGKTGNEIIKELEKNLGLPSGYISFNTLTALKQDDASVAFINYCYATGQADLAKQYIFDLTEAANKAAGEKQADKISNYLPKGWKWIPEFMYHLGYGASNAIWGKIDFFRGKTPTRTGAYTQEGIIQNEIERGWSEGKARNWANALTSAGENAADLGIGMLAGNALGAAGDAIGGTVGNIVGKVAGHAPGISTGWSAAGSAKQEMLKKGYSEKAATIYGIFSGVSEAVLQEQVGGLVGFGDRGAFTKALSGLVNQIPNAAGRTAINAVLDVASEIGQEEFGNILDSVYRSVALGEGNDVYDDFKEQFNETAVTTAISTLLLNALHIPTQIRNERGYSAIADASGMSLNDAKFLLETDAAINGGERVDPNDILRYNELTANLMASMPDNVVKAINEGKMTVADWVTSNEGVVQGKLTGKLTKDERTATQTEAVDHTETLKGKTDEQRRDYLLNAAPTGKAGSAYYTTTNGKAIEFKNLNTTQKANYVLAQKCAKAFEGSVDVVIHDTLPLSNGAMVGSDGKLHIALDVTDNKGRESIAYWTLAHEAGHALKIADGKAWNEMFDVLTDYAKNHKDRDGKNLYDALVDSITNQYKYDNNSDAFNDEMFSLIAERMVGSEGEQWAATLGDNTIFDAIAADKNASAKAKRGFLGKLKSSVEKLSRQFRDGGFSKERKRLAKIREQLTEAYKRINEVPSIKDAAVARQVERKAHEDARKLREQTERREGFREGLKAHDAEFNKQKEAREKKARDDALLEEILKGFEEEDRTKASEMASNMSEGGEVIGDLEIDNDGNVNRFSIRTAPQTEEGWDSLVNDMVAAGYTEEQAKAWIDDMRSVATEIMDAQEFLDYENDPRSSWFRKNAEYTQGTIDFSNNCPRRAEFTAQFDALMKQFPNFAFTAEDYETIRTIIKDAGIAVTCGGCYVEERRQHLSEIGQLFLDKYHAALNGETGDNALAKKFFDKISEEDKKYDITLDDIVSSDSLRKLYDEHPTLYRAFNNFNNARGMAAARLVYGLSEYNNQIKKWNKGTITRKNNLGGLRIFSYSDADPRIILDVMQIITDSASKRLMMQGYTKKPWFAVFMKNTGVRLLRSHIPMGTGYKMVKGQMVLDFDNFEGINTKDKYYSMLDRDADLNIGNNVIGINDTQIRLAMVSDIIDQIIPFHTGLKKSILHQKKLEGWNNYRDYQTDKVWAAGDNGEYKWRTVKKGGINLYTDIINAIDWGKTEAHADGSPMTDAERFVNKYLDICREKGFKPRFAQFLCDENGNELSNYGDDHFYIVQDGKKVANPDAWYTYNPGYEKFLVDFRLFDKNGKIIEQNAVAPNFDNEFVKSLFSEYIKENPQAKPMDKGVQTKIVDAMKEKYGDELNSIRFQHRATDAEYLSLAEKYRDGTATEEEKAELEKRVEEAAREAGYTIKAYHGTNNNFTVFDKAKRGEQTDFNASSLELAATAHIGFWFNNNDVSGRIGQKRSIASYLNLNNPLEYDSLQDLAAAIRESYANDWDELDDDFYIDDRTVAASKAADAFVKKMLTEGHDGVVINDEELGGISYAVLDASQIKSAYLITRDDDGNIIPPSKRFDINDEDIRYQQRDFRIDFNVPQLDTKALHEAVKGGEGTVENRFEVKYEKTDSGFAVHITDRDSGKTYDRAETVTEGNAKAEAERAAAAVIRNIKRSEQRKAFREYADKREADARLAERMHEGAIRARIERKAGETEQAYKERIKKIYEDRYRREIKNTALKWNKKLVDMLARPTENKHVPVQLARSVAEFCEEVTKYLDGTTKRGEKILDKIRKAYDRAFTDEQTILRAKSEDAGYDARGAVLNTSQKDVQLAEMLKELSEITAEKSFTELTRDEMDALLNVVRGVAHTVTEANKLIGEAEGKTVWQTGSTMIEQLENAPKVSTKLRGYLATSLDLRRLARIFSGSNEDAEFVKLVEQLNQGAIEKERVAQELQAIFKPVTDKYGDEIRKWYGRKAEWLDTGIVTKDAVPVKITKGMRVSLALHVLNEGNMRHIERGGLTIPEAKLYAQGKLADAYANGKLVRLTAEQINNIIANMTEAEKAYVEAAKQLFHDRAGFYVNKTSLQLAGYTKANVENYFPIHTDKNFNKTDFASMSMDGSIEGQGFLRERVKASNPVYLEDITSVVNRQIRGVALYAGMAIPVRNFNAVMNAAAYEDENGNWVPRTTVKQTLAKTMGAYGVKVVEGFVEDASEMSQRVDVTPVERIAGKLATNYVKAVLLGNLKVAMKQVASYPTAAAVIPWKYLAKGLASANKNMMFYAPLGFGKARKTYLEKIGREFPLFKVRQAGNANEIASITNKPGMEQKLPALLGWITTMDVETVRNIGLAAEYMVQDQHPDYAIGSEAYKQAVAQIFNQTVQQTQPNFTPLQRNAALRSKNPIVRSLTLFGTQRMQNGGILIEAAYELKQAKGKSAEEIAAARRKLGRAVASQATQNFLLLAATLAVDALRGRMKQWQDDDDELTPESIASKMGDTFLSNFLGSFLGGTEFYETVSNMYKKANGQTTYDTEFSVPALDAIETIMSFGQSGIPNFVNYITGDHTDEEKLNKLKSFSMEMAKVAGYATGLPLENAVKDVFKGFIPAYKDIRDWKKTGELIPYLWQSGKLDSKKTRERYESWIDSGHKGSAFFAIDKLLKGVGKRDDRAEILREQANLTPEDMALLMEMYDTSNGYAEGTGFYDKNGKLKYDFGETPAEDANTPTPADAQPEPAADDSSSAEDATAPAAIPTPTAAPAAQPAAEATAQPKSDKYTKAAEKWSPYGVTQTQAKSAVEKWDAFKGSYEGSRAVSEYCDWLGKQNLTGRQRFAMFSQASADLEKKATEFNKKYGTKYEALWNAYTKYNGESFHGEEYRSWVEKQTSDYYQRFALVEFAEPRSNWIEHADELHKAGVSYKAVWEAARYAKNQSGRGKKDRIIAYAKKLGMTSKQAENIYKWFG